jgi:hypothetical protein
MQAQLEELRYSAVQPSRLPTFQVSQSSAAKLCLMSEDAFVITFVANLMEVKVLYVQQGLWYEISSYWHFNV